MSNRSVVRVTLAAVAVALLGGCGPPTLDTTSLEKLQLSIAEMQELLEPADQERFQEALKYLAGGVTPADAVADPALEPLLLGVFRPLENRAAEALISQAYARRAGQVREIVAELETRRDAAVEVRSELSRLRLSRALVFKRNRGFLQWPVIQLEATNGAAETVHLIRLRASLLAAGEPEPWMLEDIDRLVMGGLAPGASEIWRIEPEQQEWIQLIDPHPNVSFSLEVTGLYGLGGRVLAETDWTAVEAHRLDVYRATMEQITATHRLALDRPPSPWPKSDE